MKKIACLGLLLTCFSACIGAAEIYCPATITCTQEGSVTTCYANPALGNTWVPIDSTPLPPGYAGTFPWHQAGNIGDNGGWCSYETHNAGKAEYIYFANTGLIYPDRSKKGNNWNLVGHGCWSDTNAPEECPFTDERP